MAASCTRAQFEQAIEIETREGVEKSVIHQEANRNKKRDKSAPSVLKKQQAKRAICDHRVVGLADEGGNLWPY